MNVSTTKCVKIGGLLSLEATASKIGVSGATIRNWTKAGYLSPTSRRPLQFNEKDVLQLNDAIRSGTVNKLKARANKSKSAIISVSAEYLGNGPLLETVVALSQALHQERQNFCISTAMFLVSLRMLEIRGEVRGAVNLNISRLSEVGWRRHSIRREMLDWYLSLNDAGHFPVYDVISDILHCHNLAVTDDILGSIYQALASEGHKSTRGAYYTPPRIVEECLKHGLGTDSFLDPCCGTGQFMIGAARNLQLPLSGLYGFDFDEIATRVARLNLLLHFSEMDTRPNIECLNAITELATGDAFCKNNCFIGKMGFIATNPPWGAYKNKHLASSVCEGVKSNETFSLILAKCIKLLRVGGRLSFILPESVLNIKCHADIRDIVLSRTSITEIAFLGRPFSGVFTPVIRLNLVKGGLENRSFVAIGHNGVACTLDQERFRRNRHFTFDVGLTREADHILKKLDAAKSASLAGNSVWALGIVTGNNRVFVKDKPEDGTEPVYKGSDVGRFHLREARSYLVFEPKKFQQVAKTEFYRAPVKLVYKFISNRLVFAYDDKQRITLNSANILIPKIPGISPKIALAYLNSKVFQYIFVRRFSTHKVLRGDLETLPFPSLSEQMSFDIENLVNQILEGENKTDSLDELVYRSFNLSASEVAQVESSLK